MNKKLILIGILLLLGVTLSGCVGVGGYGHGYGYGYYSYPDSYGYGYYGYSDRNHHRDWDGHGGSWGESRHWR
jgi:hypothetical protein